MPEPQPKPVKPGIRSTEFVMAALVLIAATVLVALGKLDPTAWAASVGVTSGAYSLGRGKAKGEGL